MDTEFKVFNSCIDFHNEDTTVYVVLHTSRLAKWIHKDDKNFGT